jgi:hypothetical protein
VVAAKDFADEGADDDADRWTRVPMIAAVTTTRPTAMGLRVLRIVVRAAAV